jgi:hypothetical protein
MTKKTTVIAIVAVMLFATSTALVTVAVGCSHRTDWDFPWLTFTMDRGHDTWEIGRFSPIVLGIHVAACIVIARAFVLLLTRKSKNETN